MTILRDFIDAQHLHCERLTSIILHHAAQPGAVTIEGGNTADLADLAEMRDILDGADYAPTPDGLHGMAEDLDCRHNEVASAKDGLMLIVSHDDIENLTLAELVTAAGEALDSLHRERDGAIAAIAKARQTISAAMGVSPITSIGVLSEDVADTMSALRRALGCPDGASAGQIVAEAALLRKEADTTIADRADLAHACTQRDEARAKLGELCREIDDQCKEIDALRAEIAALTPGPWTRLGDMAPNIGETVLMWSGVQGTPTWMQVFHGMAAQSVPADYLWRPLPAGLLDVPAPTVAP